MTWEIETLALFDEWWEGLDTDTQEDIAAAVRILEERGPTLGRPLVDTLKGSRHRNMKELRVSSSGSELRILFAFDPRRVGVLILGGDKTGQWKRRYRDAIPAADDAYDGHLNDLARKEG
jgi:hypothetical protein